MADGTKIPFAARSARLLGISTSDYIAKRRAGLRWCIRCREFQPDETFGTDPRRSDGRNTSCRASYRRPNPKPPIAPTFRGGRHTEATRKRMSQARRGPGNANWKCGSTPAVKAIRQSPEYYAWRRAVITRDDGTCQSCGARPKRPHAHHILPMKTHPQLAKVVGNGLTLCEPCHKALHNGR